MEIAFPRPVTYREPGLPEMHPASYLFLLWQRKQEREKGWPVTWDHLVTPRPIVAQALSRIDLPPAATILDAGTGTGVWIDAAAQRWPDSFRSACDFRPVAVPIGVNATFAPEQDFLLTHIPPSGYDAVLMNPPFKLAEEFVDHAWELLAPRGILVAFLRLALLAGQARDLDWWPRHEAKIVYVLPERPSFTGNGKTDQKTEYMVCVWQKSYVGRPTFARLRWKGWPDVPEVQL